jgi:hypothetical protein
VNGIISPNQLNAAHQGLGLRSTKENIMTTNHVPTSRQKLFSAKSVAKATIAAATAITAAGFLAVPTPAQARPMIPLAPGACSEYVFNGNFSLKQSNGDTVVFSSIGPDASGNATATGGINGPLHGVVTGGIQGDKVDFKIAWSANSIGNYTGFVSNDGFVHGDTGDTYQPFGDGPGSYAHWDSTVPLVCSAPAVAPAAPPVPVSHQPVPPALAQTAAARLGVSVNGPTTLPAGQSGTYTVNVSNSGDVGAPVELYISYSGKLQQTGQVSPSGGFNCDVLNYAGGTSSVHCTVGQFGPKATATIVVQGRGSAPGTGGLGVNINSSDAAAQFVQKSQKLNVTIT